MHILKVKIGRRIVFCYRITKVSAMMVSLFDDLVHMMQ